MLSFQTVVPDTLELLRKLMSIPQLSGLRLVGGTALALLYGHRRSVDLDLFGDLESDTSVVTEWLRGFEKLEQRSCSKIIKAFNINGVKVDLVNYSFYKWLYEPIEEDGLRLASPQDIAAMKVNAIIGRGTKKDFIDMYFLLQHFSFDQILSFYMDKYPEHSVFRALLSMTYFEDAEVQPMPQMFVDVSWNDIKDHINKVVKDYNKRM